MSTARARLLASHNCAASLDIARHTWALVTIIMGPRSPVTTLTIGHMVTWISAPIIIIGPNTPGVTGNRDRHKSRV